MSAYNTDANNFIDNNGTLQGDTLRTQIENKNILKGRGSTYYHDETTGITSEFKLGENGALFNIAPYAFLDMGQIDFTHMSGAMRVRRTEGVPIRRANRHFFESDFGPAVFDLKQLGAPSYTNPLFLNILAAYRDNSITSYFISIKAGYHTQYGTYDFYLNFPIINIPGIKNIMVEGWGIVEDETPLSAANDVGHRFSIEMDKDRIFRIRRHNGHAYSDLNLTEYDSFLISVAKIN